MIRGAALIIATWVALASPCAAEATANSLVSDIADAVELCASAEQGRTAMEAAAVGKGWSPFVSRRNIRVSYRSPKLKSSDHAALALSVGPVQTKGGLNTALCQVVFPSQLLSSTRDVLRERFGPSSAADALFLKREDGRIRPQTLVEMLNDEPTRGLLPNEQYIEMVISEAKHSGSLTVMVQELPQTN